jgi:hypothetical protein
MLLTLNTVKYIFRDAQLKHVNFKGPNIPEFHPLTLKARLENFSCKIKNEKN